MHISLTFLMMKAKKPSFFRGAEVRVEVTVDRTVDLLADENIMIVINYESQFNLLN
jgi:hypothetical protein